MGRFLFVTKAVCQPSPSGPGDKEKVALEKRDSLIEIITISNPGFLLKDIFSSSLSKTVRAQQIRIFRKCLNWHTGVFLFLFKGFMPVGPVRAVFERLVRNQAVNISISLNLR